MSARIRQLASHLQADDTPSFNEASGTHTAKDVDLFDLKVEDGDGFYYKQIGDDLYTPTNLTIGPWSSASQHGGPVSGLIAYNYMHHVAKEVGSGIFALHKITVHLYRPVPTKGTIQMKISKLMSSRSFYHLSAELIDTSNNKTLVRSEGLLMRMQGLESVAEFEKMGESCDAASNPQLPQKHALDNSIRRDLGMGRQTYFNTICWLKVGGRLSSGAELTREDYEGSITWTRPVPGMSLILDERTGNRVPITPDIYIAIIGDSGSGVSAILPWGKYSFTNVDFNIVWRRQPSTSKDEDFWICMKSVSRVTSKSTGLCESQFFDAAGKVASASQNLIVKELK
ncbi:hypothetical protein HDU67_007296 [Dinochytrium kinnereticum]|nr:hypothetical protein HDU67_007296 [Dinochytrium kinnereticum]